MSRSQRLWAISDIHIDSSKNHQLLLSLCDESYQNDMLVIAGDATDNLSRLMGFLKNMQQKFHTVAFVPGNHELWLHKQDFQDSIDKFEAILNGCHSLGVGIEPIRFGHKHDAVWVVPLFSWYEGPEAGDTSLYVEKKGVKDETKNMWRDYFLTRWPQNIQKSIVDYFLGLNTNSLSMAFDAPVISFSHFLPRTELIFRRPDHQPAAHVNTTDPHPEFNFSRVAGSWRLDAQIRSLGSRVHIYGHQHRNRTRQIDDVTYLSHCLGYPAERDSGHIMNNAEHPRLIWQTGNGFML